MTIRLTRKLHDCPHSNATCEVRQPAGGGPRVVVSTAAFHARVRGSVPGLGGLKEYDKRFITVFYSTGHIVNDSQSKSDP